MILGFCALQPSDSGHSFISKSEGVPRNLNLTAAIGIWNPTVERGNELAERGKNVASSRYAVGCLVAHGFTSRGASPEPMIVSDGPRRVPRDRRESIGFPLLTTSDTAPSTPAFDPSVRQRTARLAHWTRRCRQDIGFVVDECGCCAGRRHATNIHDIHHCRPADGCLCACAQGASLVVSGRAVGRR
jgi:hypothetical protein